MTGREAALWVIIGLTVAAVAVIYGAVLARRKREVLPGTEVLVLGVGITCAAWAGFGWVWWLAGGVVR